MSNELIFIGELDLTQIRKIRVQDPCYVTSVGESYGYHLLELDWEPGLYPVAIELYDAHEWGTRVKRLILAKNEARLKDRYDAAFTWLADLGVDSGQMAFMVDTVFHEDWNDAYDDENSDYKQICNLTLGGEGGVLDNKLVAASSTGYGDGQYELSCDFSREVFVVTFIEDEEDDEPEEDDYTFDDKIYDEVLEGVGAL